MRLPLPMTLNRILQLTFCAALALTFVSATAQPSLAASFPSVEQRLALFDQLVLDIERLDGDGLLARDTRPESWRETVARLRKSASEARTPLEYGHVFHRLRATYPNTHAEINTSSAYFAPWM